MKKELISLFIFIVISLSTFAQECKVSGTILSDDDKMPIIGASIIVKGTSKGTITDVNGQFSIVVQKNQSLVFSFIGYQKEDQKITTNISGIKVILKTNAVVLDEVVAVGYGTTKKSDLTGAVASVSGEQLRKLPTSGVDKALQGLSPGVTVIGNSGQPGADVTIRIRGIGTTNESSPLFVVDGVMLNDISFLSPNDIKSVEILKDASSTAIYGSQGANGVILVTTNQGNKSGKMTLSVDAYYGTQNRARILPVMNSAQLSKFWGYTGTTSADFNNWVNKNYVGSSKDYIPKGLDFSSIDTNWQDQVFVANAPIQDYHIAANGGTDKSTYSISAGYFDQQGIIMSSFYKRFTFRVNSSAQVNNWLKVGENLSLMTNSYRNDNPNSDQTSLLNSAIRFAPWDAPQYPEGTVIPASVVDPYRVAASTITNYFNPLSMNLYDHPNNTSDRLVGNAYIEIKPIKELVYKADFGVDVYYSNSREFKEVYQISPTDFFGPTNFISSNFQSSHKWQVEQTLTYTKSIGKNNFSAMVGSSISEYSSYTLGGSKVGIDYPTPANWYLNMASGDASKTTVNDGAINGNYDSRLSSFLGRLNYSYADKYLFTANFRADGSTNFPVNNLWGYFPSFSLGWKMNEEEFFAPLRPVIGTFKLRAGWGQIGNQNITGNSFFPKVTTGSEFVNYVFGTGDQQIATGGTQTSLPSGNLKWETTEQSNFGVDFGMFNNRLTGSADYYIKDTKDMLLKVVLPDQIGMEFTSPANVGQVRNQGFELLLNWRDKLSKDVNFSVGGNLATVNNNFTKMGASSPLVYENFNGEDLTRSVQGYPLYSFYGYKTDGIFQNQTEIDNYVQRDKNGNPVLDASGNKIPITIGGITKPGDVRFVDTNGDGKITSADKVILGSSFPGFTYAFNASIDFKGFDLQLSFQGVAGNKIYNCNKVLLQGLNGQTTNLSTDMLQSWTPTNHSTTIPRAYGNAANYWASDLYLEDGSYLRLKNAQIGYTLPKKILAPALIQSCRFYVSATNLLTWTKYTGYDPEASLGGVDRGNYPQAITILFGVKMEL